MQWMAWLEFVGKELQERALLSFMSDSSIDEF